MTRAFLSIGSNLGDRLSHCRQALEKLSRESGLAIAAVSHVYETEPVGQRSQPDFLNLVVALETEQSPRELLRLCQRIEQELGRQVGERWGPRVIDLDILLLGDQVVSEPDLEIPHPRMHERRFVLVPLQEIDSRARHPLLSRNAAELLAALGPGNQRVLRLECVDLKTE